jgi:hypothetical protein
MGYRSFTDSAGMEWQAWDVVPQLAERRVEERRQERKPIPFRDRRFSERRLVMSRRATLTQGLGGGWLCFEGTTGKRRLSPIPADWVRCPDAQLEEYCRMAKPVRRSAELGGRTEPTE